MGRVATTLAVVFILAKTVAFAAEKIELKKAYEGGKIELTFTGKDEGENLELKIKNLTAAPLAIIVEKGETTFEFTFNKISLMAPQERELQLPGSQEVTVTFPQSGKGRFVSGSMTSSMKPPSK